MFEDVGRTIKAILYDRITSPLFGTFVLSWCGWNWRLILLFLTDSSTAVVKKFEYVDSDIYPTISAIFIHGLLLPLATTAFFIYVYPWFARKVYGHWREQQNELKKLQLEKDSEKPLTKEEAQEITNQALLSELRYQDEREKREVRIRDLENLVKSLQPEVGLVPANEPDKPKDSSIQTLKEKFPKNGMTYSREIQEGMFSVLRMIDTLAPGSSIDKDDFMKKVPSDSELSELDNIVVLHCLDNLLEERYVRITPRGYLSVTPKGRSALVNKKFEI
ncbi:MAG: hypothetical protein WC742_09985 [Gallionellaceae bacterium]|jgi:hypothetical protein